MRERRNSNGQQRQPKKTVSHLLNFNYQQYASNQQSNRGGGGSSRGRHHHHSHHHRSSNTITKTNTQYILANYFFTLRPPTAKTIHIYKEMKQSPDPEIDDEEIWSQIELVTIPIFVPDVKDTSSEAYNQHFPRCPICLEQPPSCARVTPCGHVFCYTCLMRFMTYAEDVQSNDSRICKKCPVCAEKISLDLCKSVDWRVRREVRDGQIVELELVKRRKDSLISVRVGREFKEPETFPLSDEPDSDLSKFTIATKKQMQALIDREETQLQFALDSALTSQYKDMNEIDFLNNALHEVNGRKKECNRLYTDQQQPQAVTENAEVQDTFNLILADRSYMVKHEKTVSAEKEAFGSDSEDDEGNSESDVNSEESDQNFTPETEEEEEVPKTKKLLLTPHTSASAYHKTNHMEFDSYYFYQLIDNQTVYMHPLNTRCLIHEYQGDFSQFPTRIRAKILQLEQTELTNDLRKKIGTLQHIPLYCNFLFAEVDLVYNHYISSATKKHFDADFYAREKKRREMKKKKIQEDKRAREQEEEELRKRMKQLEEVRANLSLDSFPEIEPTEANLKSEAHFPAPAHTKPQNSSTGKGRGKGKKKETFTWGVNQISPGTQQPARTVIASQDLQGSWKQKLVVPPSKPSASTSVASSVNLDFPSLGTIRVKKKKSNR